MPNHSVNDPMRPRAFRTTRKRARPLEELETRFLLNGLTVIAHGYELSNGTPSWLTAMGSAVAARMGPNTSVYKMTLGYDSNNQITLQNLSLQRGSIPSKSSNGSSVLLIDWSADSGIGVLTPFFSTTQLANFITPYLVTPDPAAGINVPLAQGPIQLIGHSRGASLVSEIAKDLGQDGIWVDQLTTLDPHPVGSDASVAPTSNIVFADNYYQTKDPIADGAPVRGAANFGALSLSGAYASGILSFFTGGYHDNVHLFYQGTIDLSAGASDGNHGVPASWYPSNHVARGAVGYDYSLTGGGTRPAAGLEAPFGGSAQRAPVTASGAQWPNIGLLHPSTSALRPNQAFSVSYDYQSSSAAANVRFFLDSDTNPYDSNSIALGNASTLAATAGVKSSASTLAAPNSSGTYFLEAAITNGAQTRYSYAPRPLLLSNVGATRLAFSQQPTSTIAGHAVAPAVKINVTNDAGQLAVNDNSTVTLAVISGGIPIASFSAPAVNGVATFNHILLPKAGTYLLQAIDGTLAPATSRPFTISPDASTAHLVLSQRPVHPRVGTPFAPPLIFKLVDASGNLVLTNHSAVTLSIAKGPSGARLKGTLSRNLTNGYALFPNVQANLPGLYTLRAGISSLPTNSSANLTLTVT